MVIPMRIAARSDILPQAPQASRNDFSVSDSQVTPSGIEKGARIARAISLFNASQASAPRETSAPQDTGPSRADAIREAWPADFTVVAGEKFPNAILPPGRILYDRLKEAGLVGDQKNTTMIVGSKIGGLAKISSMAKLTQDVPIGDGMVLPKGTNIVLMGDIGQETAIGFKDPKTGKPHTLLGVQDDRLVPGSLHGWKTYPSKKPLGEKSAIKMGNDVQLALNDEGVLSLIFKDKAASGGRDFVPLAEVFDPKLLRATKFPTRE